jgi:hypothetical protein
MDLNQTWCWLITASQVSLLAFVNAPRVVDYSISCEMETFWWCAGLIAGRNYQDVTDTVRELIRRGIRIETVINRMSFDGTTTDPMKQAIRDSLVAFMAAMAQAQAEVTKVAHARAHDDGTKYRGRKPTFTYEQFANVRELLNQGLGVSAIAKTTGLKRQTVYESKQSQRNKWQLFVRGIRQKPPVKFELSECCSTASLIS